jgi:hypothetical protein
MTDGQTTQAPLFRSFWLAGFESACHINRYGQRLDLLAATQHDQQAADKVNALRHSAQPTPAHAW